MFVAGERRGASRADENDGAEPEGDAEEREAEEEVDSAGDPRRERLRSRVGGVRAPAGLVVHLLRAVLLAEGRVRGFVVVIEAVGLAGRRGGGGDDVGAVARRHARIDRRLERVAPESRHVMTHTLTSSRPTSSLARRSVAIIPIARYETPGTSGRARE